MTREDDSGQVTLRSLDTGLDPAPTDPGVSEVYVEPQLLPKVSEHKTLEVDTVKLHDEIDPRKRPTELKLGRVRRRPVPESNPPSTPPEGIVAPAVVTDAPRPARWIAAGVALLLICVAAFLFARTLRSRIAPGARGVPASAVAAPTVPAAKAAPPATARVTSAPSAAKPASALPSVAQSAAAIPSAPVAPLVSAAQLPQKAGAAPRATKPTPALAHPASASDSKPKHSIY